MGYFSPGAYGGMAPGAYGGMASGAYGGMIHPAVQALHSLLRAYGGMMNPNPGGGEGYWTPGRMAAAQPMNMARPLGPLMNVGALLPPVGGQAPGQAPSGTPGQAGGMAPGQTGGQAPGTQPGGGYPGVTNASPGGGA